MRWAFKMRFNTPVFFVAITALAHSSVAFPTKANAFLQICNYSTEPNIDVAFAFHNNYDKTWHSQGWYNLDNGRCKTVVNGDLTNRYYYIHAEGGDGRSWGSGHRFCTMNTAFTISGANQRCTNGTFSSFSEVDTGNSKYWTYILRD